MAYALISVSNKTGIVRFAKILTKNGYEILATDGTAACLRKGHIPVTPIEKITDFPECFDGRIKTMHPKIVGGILMRKGDVKEAEKIGIKPIDIVIVNLYPDKIDIGGVTLLRAAAKNYERVTVIFDPKDYERIAMEFSKHGETSPQLREELAAKVFLHVAAYDLRAATSLPGRTELRYGENPHQQGWFCSKSGWTKLQGKSLSYCNILDADTAWNLVCEFEEPTAACIKHMNPCGVASRKHISETFQRAYDCDPLSAFGVVVALNRPCPASVIKNIIEQKIFVEVLVAPKFGKQALELLKKRPKMRVIQNQESAVRNQEIRSAFGGFLLQTPDTTAVTGNDLKIVTKKKPTRRQIDDLLFAWKVVKHATSNAIVFAKDGVTIGTGTGQTSRVDAVELAARKAARTGHSLQDSVMASDAFFPFPDSIEEAAHHGIVAVIQPGGSIRDDDVIKRADALGMVMVVTGARAFRH